MKEFKIDPKVDSIFMPEYLRVGLMGSEYRKKCKTAGCSFDYAGFAFGQSPFHVPPPLERALGEQAGKGHYSAADGIPELREAIAGFYKRHFKLGVDASRIVIGSGTKDLIFSVFTMINGDVIIPSPSWIGYFPQLKLLGKHYHTMYLQSKNNYKIQSEELDSFLLNLARENKQHLLILNNPNNPTGALYTKEELTEIANVCRKHNTFVLADEIYALSTYKVEDFTSMGLIYPEGTFITNGLSKDRSAGGYRLGSCILPEKNSDKLRKDFMKIAATIYTNVSTPTQYAAIAAYEHNDEIEEYLTITRKIHEIMGLYFSEKFNKIDKIQATIPQGTFYFYANFNLLSDYLKRKGVMTSNELGHSLISHPHHIATVTGDALMIQPDNYGARIAFVDYDGKKAFEKYKTNPPKSTSDEIEFVKKNAPRMINGIEKLKAYVEHIQK